MPENKKGATPFEIAPHNTRPNFTTRLDRVALAINSEHTLAMQHAESAIEHARRVGQLLIEAKNALQHGEFQPWLASHVAFSTRQAQRYMSAAMGKPLPVRKIAIPKNDTVSFLTLDDITVPRFRAGEFLRAVAVFADAWRDEFLVLPDGGNGAFVAHANGPGDDDGFADEGMLITWRSASVNVANLRGLPLVFAFPWSRAEIIERYPHPGFERNVFDEVLL